MIGPSLSHAGLALAVQWGLFLPLALWLPDTPTIVATGCLAAGIWLGREFEQLWPHAGSVRPRPPIDASDVQRFIRQGLWPAVACAGSSMVWVLTHG